MPLRVVLFHVPEHRVSDLAEDGPQPPTLLINPEIDMASRDLVEDWEGCLSIPDIRGRVPRARNIVVRAFDRSGKKIEMPASGFTARVIQHEIDHLDGILFIDRADPETLGWATGSDEAEEGDPATRE